MIRWQPVVTVLLLVASWDVVWLMFSDPLHPSGSHAQMRIYGAGLALLVAAVNWALLAQHRRRGVVSVWLRRLALSALAAWWTSWCLAIVLSFLADGDIYAWGSLGNLLGISAVAVMAARVPPPTIPGQSRGDRRVSRAGGNAGSGTAGRERSVRVGTGSRPYSRRGRDGDRRGAHDGGYVPDVRTCGAGPA